jgi:hypothetical protein
MWPHVQTLGRVVAMLLLIVLPVNAQRALPDTLALKDLTLRELGAIEVTSVAKTPESV